MDAMNTSKKTSSSFINNLAADYPQFKFVSGKRPYWSPKIETIFYSTDKNILDIEAAILHELAHALLGHDDYKSDFELLKLESEAWALATKIAPNYSLEISEDHVQKCLDTYRDWLHNRSECPKCSVRALQKNADIYGCHNCQTEWKVTNQRFSRSYRRKNT